MSVSAEPPTLEENPHDVEVTVEDAVPRPAQRADQPPAFVVLGTEREVLLRPHTYCWTNRPSEGADPETEYESTCADGVEPETLPDVGAVSEPIRFRFPNDDWTLFATMESPDGTSGGRTAVSRVGPDLWSIDLTGKAGISIVRLSGNGPSGDAHTVFQTELLQAGTEPAPLVDFTGPCGELDGQNSADLSPEQLATAAVGTTGFSLSINQLGTDRNAIATVRVTTGDGTEGDLTLRPHEDGEDPEGNGHISLQGNEADANRLLALGPPPYRFELKVTIDGTAHLASFTYPGDINYETTSFQPNFEPPLPARPSGG